MVLSVRYWFPWLIIAAIQLPVALCWSIAYNSVQLYVQKRLVEQSLELYLSPKLVKKFAKNPKLLQPGAEKQMLTILFSDIASFTNISEGMDSDELARLMNNYFQNAVARCIHHTDGTVVKYIGDAIFAFWNAPDPQGDHQFRACEAALRFHQLKFEFDGKPLVTRIGLHTGVANVGNFGSTTRIDYTAIGENINLASRMEGLNKYLGTRVLITAETQEGIGARLVTRCLGLFRLKGFEKSVGVFELMGWPADDAASRSLRESFADALQKFQRRDWDQAEAAFRCVLQASPGDGPSDFYLKHIEEVRTTPPPPQWRGEIELKEK
jgi:adenylate cyclase